MKRSEIKDLYDQSDSALKLLKAMALLLPYCNGEQATAEATQKAADQAAALWNPVKIMCDYMIDDGSIDMTERLQNIKAEVSRIELSVAKMGYSKVRMPLMLNCRAIINQIKDMEAWTTNNTEHQQGHIAAPQQPDNGSSGELTGNGNESAPEGSKQPHPKSTTTNFRNKIAGNVDSDKLLAKLHTLMDGKTGKEALIYLTVCIIDGKMNRPTFKQFKAEFPYICERANYYRYTNPQYLTNDEKEAARKALDRNK